jgi:hypothetical protein
MRYSTAVRLIAEEGRKVHDAALGGRHGHSR